MSTQKKLLIIICLVLAIGIAWLLLPASSKPNDKLSKLQPDIEAGTLLLQTAGCYACHTLDSDTISPFSGGPALDSPFGTFFATNITPDKKYGIGNWTLQNFSDAVRYGISPSGSLYYPAMPFVSYAGLSDQDIVDLWSAIQQADPVSKASKGHQLPFPFNQRFALKIWRTLFFNDSPEPPSDRGQYLADHVLHCNECHTPRNLLGALDYSRRFEGNDQLPEDNEAPAITPDAFVKNDWSADDLEFFLGIGMYPDGDFVGGSMTEVVEYGTAKLSKEDLKALINHLIE